MTSSTQPFFIAVGGLMGAGKTSLCSYFGQVLNVAPSSEWVDAGYLHDLLCDGARWALEAQMSFFVGKAVDVARAQSAGQSIILDRSLEEDREVFAGYYGDNGLIDRRAMLLYNEVTSFMLGQIRTPDLLIHLDVSPAEAARRIRSRGRGEDRWFPPGYLERIADRYEPFLQGYCDSPLYRIDTEAVDLRLADNASRVVSEALELVSRPKCPAVGAADQKKTR